MFGPRDVIVESGPNLFRKSVPYKKICGLISLLLIYIYIRSHVNSRCFFVVEHFTFLIIAS